MIKEFIPSKGIFVYKGLSGNYYQYDLNNPSDRLSYQNDLAAQMRDKLSINTWRETEKGGGIYEDI
ncbi:MULTISPECIES: hypothetical protein [Avibacterium]|uniref:Uncharacterized protein n=2 Tax=Avibacterium TaxID=292486 RepID=A0AAE5TLN2_AVIPA|nr:MULTISPECIES: hypothetical protein [Avibacterium]MEE3607917.1 hypothetical protein [Avibacterium paragallinarum]MEE3620344.1 hypothetical protein [Avibacterium paragallinarum]MEE3669743.1 hypothetical protein [Avibacterium paragallinarum]MEE3679761.1 hypothetical protein [Avibacterium paragallinarum]MEE4385089.1 hypothetical protein [Avibacterium paragallinarum]